MGRKATKALRASDVGWKGIPQFWGTYIENALSPYVAVLLLGITRRF